MFHASRSMQARFVVLSILTVLMSASFAVSQNPVGLAAPANYDSGGYQVAGWSFPGVSRRF